MIRPVLAVLQWAQLGFQGTQTTTDFKTIPAISWSSSISAVDALKRALQHSKNACRENKPVRPVLAVLLWAQQGFEGAQTTTDLQILPATSRS